MGFGTMRILLAALAFSATTMTASAADAEAAYRDALVSYPVAIERPVRKTARTRPHPAAGIDTRRPDDGSAARAVEPLTPGYRNAAGFYVPPTYSTHPRSLADDNGSRGESYGGFGVPNPFGGLGTRR